MGRAKLCRTLKSTICKIFGTPFNFPTKIVVTPPLFIIKNNFQKPSRETFRDTPLSAHQEVPSYPSIIRPSTYRHFYWFLLREKLSAKVDCTSTSTKLLWTFFFAWNNIAELNPSIGMPRSRLSHKKSCAIAAENWKDYWTFHLYTELWSIENFSRHNHRKIVW